MKYNHKKIEKKWQKKWEKEKIYEPDLDKVKNPFYNLMMFPYPSAEGLHVGNMYAFTHSDTYGRFMRLRGFDVFEPIGLDGFGIHSENYAIKIGEHIKDVSKRTEKNFYKQLHVIGNAYDWNRTVETYNPNYYKWTQWLFLQMYKKGLAYRKEAAVNWCPSCKTVLSDEQVIQEKCERCDNVVEKKKMEQWFWKITDYAEKLLGNLDKIDWSEDVKLIQKNWIGKSEGAEVVFETEAGKIKVFTTRPDTLFGCTFIVLSLDHELANRVKTAINPVNKKEIPVFVSEYVLSDYGTGAIMAVPAHDQRDWEFAKENNLEIIEVVGGGNVNNGAFEEEGRSINSDFLNGLQTPEAKEKMIQWLEEKGIGKRATSYKLRDWCISRQRYWGPPIPMIDCPKCGWVPVPEEDLPVLLPEMDDFLPDGTGKGPLNKVEDFVKTKCPECGGDAKRETDVSDPFVDSCWYYMRYLDPHNDKEPFDKLMARKWMPVDMYIGGKEHSVLHLLYSRFVTMVMYELGYVPGEEPFKQFRAHGLLIKDGAKISKSKGNIVNPDEYVEKFGADTVRMYLMFLGEMRQGGDWRDDGIVGTYRFLNKVWRLAEKSKNSEVKLSKIEKVLHQTIKKVTEDLENLKFNTAISQLMILVNAMEQEKGLGKEDFVTLIILLAPFAPHITEEIWSNLPEYDGESIHNQKWPKYDSAKIEEDEVELIVQFNGKFRGNIMISKDLGQKDVEEKIQSSGKFDKYLKDVSIKKIIFVPNKLINFVV